MSEAKILNLSKHGKAKIAKEQITWHELEPSEALKVTYKGGVRFETQCTLPSKVRILEKNIIIFVINLVYMLQRS